MKKSKFTQAQIDMGKKQEFLSSVQFLLLNLRN